ncbi:MAG TPA: hypothetical protein PK728_06875 [Bacillota bacterium]|nr:hypothetical protein [Bacillota bacterium]
MLPRAGSVIPVSGRRGRNLLLVLLLLTLFVFANLQLLAPGIKAYLAGKSDLEELRSRVETLDAIAGSIENENDAVNAAAERRRVIGAQLSAGMQDGTVLFILDRITKETRVVVRSCQAGVLSVKEGGCTEILLKITVSGDYRDVLAFLEQLEKKFCLNQIVHLVIKPRERPAAARKPADEAGTGPGLQEERGAVTAELSMLMYADSNYLSEAERIEMDLWPAGRGNPFLESASPVLP